MRMQQGRYVTAEFPHEAISTIDQNFTQTIPGRAQVWNRLCFTACAIFMVNIGVTSFQTRSEHRKGVREVVPIFVWRCNPLVEGDGHHMTTKIRSLYLISNDILAPITALLQHLLLSYLSGYLIQVVWYCTRFVAPFPGSPPTQNKQLLVTERRTWGWQWGYRVSTTGTRGCGHDKEVSVFNSDHYSCLFKRIVVREPAWWHS